MFTGETDCTYYFDWETAYACVKEKEDLLCRVTDATKHYDLSPLTRFPGETAVGNLFLCLNNNLHCALSISIFQSEILTQFIHSLTCVLQSRRSVGTGRRWTPALQSLTCSVSTLTSVTKSSRGEELLAAQMKPPSVLLVRMN